MRVYVRCCSFARQFRVFRLSSIRSMEANFYRKQTKNYFESGNIYYDSTDTNEGILDFIFNQQNPVTGDIDLKIKDFFNSYLLILTVFNIGNLKTINSSPLTFTSKSFLSLGESGVKVIFASVGLK